ncbi:MAG: hypothetical protein U9P42_00925 [Candidatus Fermentibacteria bacterium]|nr:hypothetical protein [Candidatus Fermentibacteria bacterium]
MKLVLLVLVVAVALSFAGQITSFNINHSESTWQGSDAEDILWSQLPTGSAMASQYFDDMYPGYDSGVADDFEFAESTTINKIRWWGGYWNGAGGPIDSPVEIYLYLDDGTGNAPTLPQHSSAIQSWMISAGDYTEVADGSNFVLEYEFPSWVVFDADVKYWFEIRKAFPFDPLGQYGWIQSDPIALSPCVQGFDGLGTVWWTAQTTDAAFELIFDDVLALERSTWAGIKANF